jgi:hypothetical protein
MGRVRERRPFRRSVAAMVVLGALCTSVTRATADETTGTTDDGTDKATNDDAPIVLVARQHLGAGYDTNPALSPPPEVRRVNATAAAVEDLGARALAGGEASLGAFVGDPWWAGVSLDLDGRWYVPGADHEGRYDAVLGLRGGWEGTEASAVLSLEGERYDASFGDAAAWTGRPTLRGVWKLAGTWHFGAQVGGTVRAYDSGEQRDLGVSVGMDAAYRPWWGYALVGLDLDRRVSTTPGVPDAVRGEFGPRVAAGLAVGPVSLDAAYFLLRRVYDAPDQNEIEHLVRVEAVWWLAPWIGPFVRGELGLARGEADALAYDRLAVFGGVTARFGSAPSPREQQRVARQRQGPATIADGRVRFRFLLPRAREVAVIGSFNGWSEEAGRLTPVGDGWFEAERTLAPGRYRYRLVVDGTPIRAPGAPAYAPDDFGGEDAVLVVPARDP